LTLDYDERTALGSISIFFSAVSAVIAALLPLEIVERAQDVRQGWIVVGLVFGTIFALPFVGTVAVIRERPEFQRPPEPLNLRKTVVEPFRIRASVNVLMMYLFVFVATDVVSSIIVFFVKNYLNRTDEANLVSGEHA